MSILPQNLPYKWINTGIAAAFVAVAAMDSFYQVEPSEVANVRRFNQPLYDTPVGTGPHFKLPFIDKVDRAQLSQRTLETGRFAVTTEDNQRIVLDVSLDYELPLASVNRMLYDIGRTNDGDIDDNSDSLLPIIMDRAGRAFAAENTTSISANRDAIQAKLTAAIYADMREMFGLNPIQLKMKPPVYSDTFVDSNEEAAAKKNEAVAEENRKESVQAVANQTFIRAKGDADARIKEAEGAASSMIMTATADRDARLLQADGERKRLLAEIAPFGNPEKYIEYLEQLDETLWNGARSQVEVVGGSAGAAPVVVPVPGLR